MNRFEKTFSFWEKQTPSLEAMLLRSDAQLIEEEERKEILGHLPSLPGKRVLELGAGIGRFTSHFASEAAETVAVDFIPHFVAMNKKSQGQSTSVKYVCEDVIGLKFAGEQFDFIFINHLLMYLEDVEVKRLAEHCQEWLKKEGHLFFRESCSASGKHFEEEYYVHYRTLFFYTDLFKGLRLLKQESLKLFELRFANPFQCFWLYQKE